MSRKATVGISEYQFCSNLKDLRISKIIHMFILIAMKSLQILI